MKVAITPSNSDSIAYWSVTLEIPHDDVDIIDAVDLVRAALVAWGYDSEAIAGYFKNES